MDTIDLVPYRFSVDLYHAMIEAEILTPDDKVELLDGVIVEITPEGDHHLFAATLFTRWLVRSCPDELWVQVGGSMTLRPDSEPAPDHAVVDPRSLGDGKPTYAHLIVEISFGSIAKDRGRKAALYARHGVPEYWIFNLVANHVIVHREPVDDVYTYTEIVRPPGPLQCQSVELPPLDLAPYFP